MMNDATKQAALGQAGKVVLRSHVQTCVSEAMTTSKPSERQQKISELMEVFARYGGLGKGSVVGRGRSSSTRAGPP